jgi:hypothetical protein
LFSLVALMLSHTIANFSIPENPAMSHVLPIAKSGEIELVLLSQLANRHGLITGATGTGKTVTLQRIAEQLSAAGVPVFLADAKGDLSGLGVAGAASEKLQARLDKLGIKDWQPKASPVMFWDVFGESGHPVRATISDMGPLLLAACSTSTTPRAACCNWCSRSPTTRACCCST